MRAERPRGTAPHAETPDLRSVERAMIEKAPRETRYNKSKAARRLGLTRTQL